MPRLASHAIGPLRIVRWASHQAQGVANGAKDGPGKRLGAKKAAGDYVVNGTILFRQRGTLWMPGDNCFMGRDHTIMAGTAGFVRYYRDPARHPDKKYIGVVIEKDHTLPRPQNAARRRRLGMLAYKMPSTATSQVAGDLAVGDASTKLCDDSNSSRTVAARSEKPRLRLSPSNQYRQANYQIGQAMGQRHEHHVKQKKTKARK
ncbi:hypothetical protein K470DRAFT_218542 [Piedraia hortae CBS 480.64]|uniref:Large ribosomal subunit protein bL27m n=1 Tax=Piedraia hortae CBS 480.64 TaxID=1314780 RepID=A0A6A7BX16_9PEZI|nr:hypothetical protein K470DRAFT_218542 [Piedraia hortae CBS 480.64]